MHLQDIYELSKQFQLADTHEHLVEESSRMVHGDHWQAQDFSTLFAQYPESDLRSSGMTDKDAEKLLSKDMDPREKWILVKPFWERIKYTGYGRLIQESLSALFDYNDITDDNWEDIDTTIRNQIVPGYYKKIVKDIAGVDHMHVNSLEDVTFMEAAYSDWMLQDISFLQLSVTLDFASLEKRHNVSISSLKDMLALIDSIFVTYGPRAIAVKNQGAYLRRLDFEKVSLAAAEQSFDSFAKSGFKQSHDERKPLEDFLFHECVSRAVEYDLPVKLHTGYYAGQGSMPLSRVGMNPSDCSELCLLRPEARFVFMHSMYPYGSELIAIAKQFRNAFADMCWTWIISPEASVNFLKEALTTVPLNKMFLFGGDHCQVELIPGHANIARKGLAVALRDLLSDGWLNASDIEPVVKALTHGNADLLYDVERCRKNLPKHSD